MRASENASSAPGKLVWLNRFPPIGLIEALGSEFFSLIPEVSRRTPCLESLYWKGEDSVCRKIVLLSHHVGIR